MIEDVNAHSCKMRRRCDRFLDWLLPTRCLVCGQADNALCGGCAQYLRSPDPACGGCAMPLAAALTPAGRCGQCLCAPLPFDRAYSALIYQWPVDQLICRFKFQQAFACGRVLATIMANAASHWQHPEVLIPVPLHRQRLRQRGYDQTLLLARSVASRCHLPCRSLLVRHQFTTPQSQLSGQARHANVSQAFCLRHIGKTRYRHVALIDDVMTTGATLAAAALCLRPLGIERIDAWVCARTLDSTAAMTGFKGDSMVPVQSQEIRRHPPIDGG